MTILILIIVWAGINLMQIYFLDERLEQQEEFRLKHLEYWENAGSFADIMFVPIELNDTKAQENEK